MNARCVRLSLYRHSDHLLLDVQQVTPLPEANELVGRLRKREAVARVAKESNLDLTKYVVKTPTGETGSLPKRRAVLALVKSTHEVGVREPGLSSFSRCQVQGHRRDFRGRRPWSRFAQEHDQHEDRRKRWFLDEPLHEDGRTWGLFSNWGRSTEPTLEALFAVAPTGFEYTPVEV